MRKKIAAMAAATTVVVGAVGLTMIQDHEGLRTRTYIDPVGIPTVCWGHTGQYAVRGAKYTREECEAILLWDVQRHREGIERCITYDLNRNQWDAVTSFAFNIGVGGTCRSTMVRKINRGDLSGASREFPKWKYAGGRVFRGLVRRRAEEQKLFNTPVASAPVDTTVTFDFLKDLDKEGDRANPECRKVPHYKEPICSQR